jgi:hypothetical protein
MRRYWYLPFAAMAAAALAVLPIGASASTGGVLTVGSAGGTSVNSGDTLNGTLVGSATFFSSTTGTTGVTCTTSTTSATDGTNPAAPGTATETLNSQTFSNCKTNVVGTTGVQSVSVDHLSYNVSITDSSGSNNVSISAGSAGAVQTTVKVNTIFGPIACVYQLPSGTSAIVGSAPLGSSSGISFKNVQFNKTSGPGTCFSPAFFSATYTFVDASQGGGPTFVN